MRSRRTQTSWPLVKSWTTQFCSELRPKSRSTQPLWSTHWSMQAGEHLSVPHQSLRDSKGTDLPLLTICRLTMFQSSISYNSGTSAKSLSSSLRSTFSEQIRPTYQPLSPSSTRIDSSVSCAVKYSSILSCI